MKAFYDDPSFDYQKYWTGREYENEAERIVLRRLFKLIASQKNILDIGGGFGRLVPEYASIFKNCLLIDPSEKHLREAEKLCKKYKNFSVKKGTIEKLPEKNEKFDVVLAVRIFHHLKEPHLAIKEIFRVLKPEGFLILEFPNKIRFINILKAFLKLDLDFFTNHHPVRVGKKNKTIPFFSYHPNQIKTLLLTEGFKIIKTFSVSNFRHPLIKKIVPLKLILKMEALFSYLSSFTSFLKFWGPSIFVLAQKTQKKK